MTTFGLILRNLLFYWRTNLAVLLGVAAGTAVIGGALVVGDSVRGSLRQMTLDRLGDIDHALAGGRFFREKLAEEIAADEKFQRRFRRIAPALAMQAAVTRRFENASGEPAAGGAAGSPRLARAGGVNLYGIDERLWRFIEPGASAPGDAAGLEPPAVGEAVISSKLAEALAEEAGGERRVVQPGETIRIAIQLPAAVPRDTLLGGDQRAAIEFDVTVKAVLPEAAGAGRLELNPSQQLPLNAYVSLGSLQQKLGLHQQRIRSRELRGYIEKPARVNALFVEAKTAADRAGATAEEAADSIGEILEEHLEPTDLYLRLVESERGYVSLESEQQILATVFADAAERAAAKLDLTVSRVLVYLANQIRNADETQVDYEQDRGYSMYSAVAGLEFPLEEPFGPFAFAGPRPEFPLEPNGLILNSWLAEDLGVEPGDRIVMTWHEVGSHGELPEVHETFVVRGIARLADTPAADRGLTPEVEGITDADSFSDWERKPFPLEEDLITGRDEMYWDQHRATPKAFLQLDAAEDLWRSRYGQLTSFRVAPRAQQPLEEVREGFAAALLEELDAARAGLAFRAVKAQGLRAASGTTDFAGLFLGFSFFLILAATILIGLLFRLGVERRSAGVGVLSAVGFPPQRVRRMILGEGLCVVLVGGLLGVAAAVAYAHLIVYGLKTWWIAAVGTRFLDVYVQPGSLAIGFGIAVAVAAAAVWWALRQLRHVSTRDLLAGATERALSAAAKRRRGRLAAWLAAASFTVAALIAGAALLGLVPASEAFMGISWRTAGFFVVGVLMLTAGLAFLASWLDADKSAAMRGRGAVGLGRLGTRNASRNRLRSVLTTGLIATATFVIVAVAAGHRDPSAEKPDKQSGNGGFLLVAQTATPILADLNDAAGRRQLGLVFEPNATDDAARRRQLERSRKFAESMNVMPFRVKPGENASCLNLYQTQLPTILGVPLEPMVKRGGFKFVGAERENPWTILGEELNPVERDGRQVPVYPVFGDLNTLMYSLHKAPGESIAVPDEEHPDYLLKIVGAFDSSVFQGVLVMSEADFLKLYPEVAGYAYFLIEADPALETELSTLLETRLSEQGFDAEPVAERIAAFLKVQNTYLSTFQALGGLGLLLGTLGLATVMLRNVLERRGELALMRAVGFTGAGLGWLIAWENAVLLGWGLATGAASALVAMLPHLTSTGADVPWLIGGASLAAVFVAGMAAAVLAVREAVRTPIVSTLRSE